MYSVTKTVNQIIPSNTFKQALRYGRNYARKNRVVDPGIQHRKSLVNESEKFEQLNDYDYDLEADFMNVAATHKEYEYEQNLLKEKEKYLIVKQKYFKEKLPNFLTWTDKEQIRYLHNTNPEEWTVEKLSEGFPALPEVIAKIVKSTWTKTDNKIRNHDESVKKNWALFKEGKLSDLPPNVVVHLKKFTNRDLSVRTLEMPVKFVQRTIEPNVTVGSEFSEIIKSYERLKNKDKNDTKKLNNMDNNKLQKPPKKDTYLLDSCNSKQHSKHTTLDHLQQHVQKKSRDGKDSADNELMLNVLEQENQGLQIKQFAEHCNEAKNLQPTTIINNAIDNKYTSNSEISTGVKKLEERDLDYPDRIVIPRDKFKRGYTYKLNDCYYDDDGEFLYRVPGMY